MTASSKTRIIFGLIVLLAGCTYKDIPAPTEILVDCSKSTFAIAESDKVIPTSCLSINGSFTVHASGGASPYLFSFNGAPFQGDSTLAALGPGTYLVTARDANLCQQSISVDLSVEGSTLVAEAVVEDDSECLTDNGTITVNASGGTPPYRYQFGTLEDPNHDNSRTGLKFGYYVITVRDTTGCLRMLNAWVHRANTGTSFAASIKPIFDANCSIPGCHNGDNGPTINWTTNQDGKTAGIGNIQKHAANIKKRTGNRTMPATGSLTQSQIDLIACWVDDGALDN